jgi:hypothetical protein
VPTRDLFRFAKLYDVHKKVFAEREDYFAQESKNPSELRNSDA